MSSTPLFDVIRAENPQYAAQLLREARSILEDENSDDASSAGQSRGETGSTTSDTGAHCYISSANAAKMALGRMAARAALVESKA